MEGMNELVQLFYEDGYVLVFFFRSERVDDSNQIRIRAIRDATRRSAR